MRYPDIAQAIAVASELLNVSREALTTQSVVQLLDSALHSPQAAWDGEDLVQGIIPKAATLCFHVVRNHPLPDGNKRLGWLLLNIFLEMNEHVLHRDAARSIALMWCVGAGEASAEDIEHVITPWVRPQGAVAA